MRIEYGIRPYYIEFLCTEEDLNYRMQFPTKESIDTTMITGDISFDIDGLKSVIICDGEKIKHILNFLESLNLEFRCIDAADMFFNGEVPLENANDEFKKTLSDFLSKSYDVDDVLDKISQKGPDCLSEFDKRILEGFSEQYKKNCYICFKNKNYEK